MSVAELLAATPEDGRHAAGWNRPLVLDVPPVGPASRKHATILFADLEGGSMELARSIDVEQWWSVICELVELASAWIYRYEGWIANFTGDGVLAVFEGSCGHAQRACEAALSLRDVLNDFSRESLSERGLALRVRMGLNSGEVLTGTIGGPHARYFTASGYTVSLAKRIEGLAIPGRVYVSGHTAALLADWELDDLGVHAVKGASSPVRVFELVRRSASDARLQSPSPPRAGPDSRGRGPDGRSRSRTASPATS